MTLLRQERRYCRLGCGLRLGELPWLDPLGVVLARPLLTHVPERHAAKCVAGGWVDEREVEVAGDDDERGVHQGVVDEDRAREAEARVSLAVPEQEAGDEEEDGKRCGQGGVQLLAGVEAALRRAPPQEPAAVV